MYALIGTFKMDPSKHAEQRAGLHERIIPTVKQQPGFVSGYWSYDLATSKHYSHIVFDTQESAQQLAGMVSANVREHSKAGVEIESLAIVEVLGDAQR